MLSSASLTYLSTASLVSLEKEENQPEAFETVSLASDLTSLAASAASCESWLAVDLKSEANLFRFASASLTYSSVVSEALLEALLSQPPTAEALDFESSVSWLATSVACCEYCDAYFLLLQKAVRLNFGQ